MTAPSLRILQIVVDTAELEWMDWASCAEVGGDAWFPEKGGNATRAKAICRSCPVQAECLDYAEANNILSGVWGGLSETERFDRRSERRSQQGAAA